MPGKWRHKNTRPTTTLRISNTSKTRIWFFAQLFAIPTNFIYKISYAPTKTEPDVTPAFVLLSRTFLSAIVSPRSGGLRSGWQRTNAARNSLTLSAIIAICVHPKPSGWLRQFMKTKAPKASSRYPTPALEKGLDILEMFASEPTGLTKSEVARKLGRTISEIFRMLVCLEERGYTAQSPDSDRYNLTLHLFMLAQEHPPIKRMTMQALPIMQQVAHELSQSCHLGVLNGGA